MLTWWVIPFNFDFLNLILCLGPVKWFNRHNYLHCDYDHLSSSHECTMEEEN